MDLSHAPEFSMPTHKFDFSSLPLLLRRGLDYIQQGYHSDGFAFLILAREQMSPDQTYLITVLDAFLQRYTYFQRIQHDLQEIITRFAEARQDLQAQTTTLESDLAELINPQDAVNLLLPSLTNTKNCPLTDTPIHQEQITHLLSLSAVQEDTSITELTMTCFGRFEVRRMGEPITLCSSRSGQKILRYLVASPGRSASCDKLQTLLWPEDEPEVAQRKLHIAISALRRSLSEGTSGNTSYIIYKQRVYALNPAVKIHTDVDAFLSDYRAGQQQPEECITFYERACHLYTGSFLAEDLYADWSFLQREQLRQIYLTMQRCLANHYFKQKRYEETIHSAMAILKEDRCDEAAHRQLIQVYAAQNRRSEAIQQYQRCEHVLREELGVQPQPETVTLFQTFLCQAMPINTANI